MEELKCPCGQSLLPGSDATEEYVDAWLAEHADHKAPGKAPEQKPPNDPGPAAAPAKLDVEELCRREGYAARPYANLENAVIFTDEVDALVCARALRKKDFKVLLSGYILEVMP